MEIDLATTHGWIVNEYHAQHSLADSMQRLIDQCADACPHADWQEFRKFPYDDLSGLAQWIENVFRLEPPADSIRGLWFGLFNPCYDELAVADIYVCGSEHFVSDPDDCEWAVGPKWWPEARYAHSKILASIYCLAYKSGGLGNNAEYPLCLGYGVFVVRELMNGLAPSGALSSIASAGVAVGFDSGDFVLLGRVTSSGLGPI